MNATNFSEREFRDVMGRYPTGVAVVTPVNAQRENIGITVNSFTSVSLRPPLIAFSLDKRLRSLNDWLETETFVVNFLAESQNHVSQAFAVMNGDKWSSASFNLGKTANPILDRKIAALECKRYDCHEAGDHFIMIGQVLHLENEDKGDPLVFHRGRYRTLAKHEEA